jgi:hypothetical protein
MKSALPPLYLCWGVGIIMDEQYCSMLAEKNKESAKAAQSIRRYPEPVLVATETVVLVAKVV